MNNFSIKQMFVSPKHNESLREIKTRVYFSSAVKQ